MEDILVYYDQDNNPIFNCADVEALPKIEILFGGYWLEVLPKDYLLPIYRNTCGLCIMDSMTDEWILGDAFLRGFYSAHDHEKKRFGFAPHTLSEKRTPYPGTTPNRPI